MHWLDRPRRSVTVVRRIERPWLARVLTRFRRRWLVWRVGRWRDRYVRCYECGAVSRGKRAYHIYRGYYRYARWLGCGHEVQPYRGGVQRGKLGLTLPLAKWRQ